MDRYNRHIILSEIGPKGQEKLAAARVLVVGAGGLGCPVLQYLAAAGVGTIGIIDNDVVEESNLQRQILFGSASLGQNKAVAAKDRLNDLNNTIQINAYPEKLTFHNAMELFREYDIIVDGTDNFEARYLINDASVLSNKPVVFGAIHKFQGQVSVFNYNNGPTYRCVFPNKPGKHSVPNCSEVGVLGVLPGIIGTLLANEVLKVILGLGKVLSGKLLCYDALSSQVTTINVKRKEVKIQKVLQDKKIFQKRILGTTRKVDFTEVSLKEVMEKQDLQLIDVRELHEQPKVDDHRVLRIPLSRIEQHLDEISDRKIKAIFCQSGIRSKQAVSVLHNLQVNNCFSLKEGASEINRVIKESFNRVTNE
ncbi:adenylyltransferase and sulfurtransferase [Salinimicrobium sediminis]|uniref:Molybdopterin-synthase adenylyltransferase n=1 Tax=Salinimicrobium sediminis TaxID=1343891 RepID=A0A285X1Q9_9FLAO|nr:HesA/MoeB/ThiF family protein [Salinimicrobium sediminis]SOC79301.1 adenylyltransferase and sulfurtransferase [Salinimicrobium sediminis]